VKKFLILIPLLFLIGCATVISNKTEKIIGKNSNLLYTKDTSLDKWDNKSGSFRISEEDEFIIYFGTTDPWALWNDFVSLDNPSGYFTEVEEQILFTVVNFTNNKNIIQNNLNNASKDFCENAEVNFSTPIYTDYGFFNDIRTKGSISCPENINKNIALKKQEDIKIQKQKEAVELELKEKEEKEELDSMLAKQETCKTLGFKMGTEKNGECVLKLMELETQVAASTQTIINNSTSSDNAAAKILAETQRQMLIQRQSQALMNMGSALINSGNKPRINCTNTFTGWTCN